MKHPSKTVYTAKKHAAEVRKSDAFRDAVLKSNGPTKSLARRLATLERQMMKSANAMQAHDAKDEAVKAEIRSHGQELAGAAQIVREWREAM